MLYEFYSKTHNIWIDMSKCGYALTNHVRTNQYNKNKKYYFYENEVITDKTKIKYKCDKCQNIFESSYASYKNREHKLCLKCIQKIKSNDPIIKERKRQAVLKYGPETHKKRSQSLKNLDTNIKRIKAFQKTMNNLSKDRKDEIKNKKQQTWFNKSENERLLIMEKQRNSGTLWTSIKTKFGEIKCQGYEDRAVIKLLELNVDKLERGPSVKMDNGHWHYPDLYTEKDGKKIIIEVKSNYLYKKYKDDILYKKSQGIKNTSCDYYFIWIFDDKQEVDCQWL